MKVELTRAGIDDAKELHSMQTKSFQALLDKYQDFDTNPANETIEQVASRLKQNFTYYYFICLGSQKVGAIRIVDEKKCRTNTFLLYL